MRRDRRALLTGLLVALSLGAGACRSQPDPAARADAERGPGAATASTAAEGPASTGVSQPAPAAETPAPTVPPELTGSSGGFEVRDGTIIDPTGRAFIPYGTNMNGPHSFFAAPTLGQAAALQAAWGFNTIRLVTCLPGGCQGVDQPTNNDLDAIVAEYTAHRMVVMIDYHQLDFGASPTEAEMTAAIGFWTRMSRRFGSNPYVWFNLFNEPEASFHDAERGGTAPARWRAQHQRVIDAVRGEGASNVIVIDDTQAGQGAVDWWQIGPSPAADSGVLSEGAALEDPRRRIVFSFHPYDVWGFPNDGSHGCANRYSDAQRDARLSAYLERVAAAGFALIAGEIGFRPQDRRTSGVSFHGEGGAHPPCGSTMRLAAEAFYRVAPRYGIGALAWHGFDLVSEGPQAFGLVGNPSGNLTEFGALHRAHGEALAARR